MNQLVTQVRTQQWITMVREQRNSGQTVKSWCKENHISENCFYYRQHRIRELIENEVPKFIEIHRPDVPASGNVESLKSAAIIRSGKLQIDLDNSASEELIARIVRVLNAQ